MTELDLKDPEILKKKLNLDTAKIDWQLLHSYQQDQAVIEVSESLDLIEVASEFVLDNHANVKAWLDSGQIEKVSDEKATKWHQEKHAVWAVVVAPWVLVQDKKASD